MWNIPRPPFYLAVWPELQVLELNQWCEYALSGEEPLGSSGVNTLFLCHDMGKKAYCHRQAYPHHIEVEENTNWVLMVYAHWRRTGRESVFREHTGVLKGFLDYLLASDTTGSGIPDCGVANTIETHRLPCSSAESRCAWPPWRSVPICWTGSVLRRTPHSTAKRPRRFAAR
ncbi:MAG: DUF4965 domain-containing protein [Armatimonadetes bacterium]|nr:DUF4965 domain-containing protein [Armatimonadota bacterium]